MLCSCGGSRLPSGKLTVLLRIDGYRGLLQGFTFISKSILAFARHSCRVFAVANDDLCVGSTAGRHFLAPRGLLLGRVSHLSIYPLLLRGRRGLRCEQP
jgi:hypothetical protein